MNPGVVIDTSAILAILFGEAEAGGFMDILASSRTRLMNAFSYLESSVVVASRKGPQGLADLDDFVQRLRIRVVPLFRGQAELARDAYQRFGKGRDPAGLNLGDCCSYALARHTGLPLLFKGDDFSRTDIKPAALPPT